MSDQIILENIRSIRTALGLSQSEVAQQLDIDITNYSRMETGKAKLTTRRVEELARIFDVSPATLYVGHEEQTPKATPPSTITLQVGGDYHHYILQEAPK